MDRELTPTGRSVDLGPLLDEGRWTVPQKQALVSLVVVLDAVQRVGGEAAPLCHTGGVIGASVPVWDIREGFGDATNMLVSDLAMGATWRSGWARDRRC